MTLDHLIPLLIFAGIAWAVYAVSKPKRPVEGSIDHKVEVAGELITQAHVAAAFDEPAAPEQTISTIEELMAEGMTAQEARAEIRAQKRDQREQIALQNQLSVKQRREQRELVAQARATRSEERANARIRAANIRTGVSVAKSIGRLLK
jgi:uncharacterized protein YoaH (UPF0181 family)